MSLLTIGIPTYNRARHMQRLLEAIVPACEAGGQIEILVSDNCSTDDTHQVAAGFSSFKCFRYIRVPENRGFDRNILNLLDNAAGKFLWLMGDDDLIRTDHLADIVKLLAEKGGAPLFFINYVSDRERLNERKGNMVLSKLQVGAQKYTDRYLYRASLISTNIINIEYYKKLAINRECISKGWIHLHLLLLLADRLRKSGEKIVIVRDKIVIQGSEEGDYPLEKWVRIFINDFSFTIENTAVRQIDLRRFLKGFYDINIRPTFLTAANLVRFADPIENYRQIVRIFNMNLTGRISFWLQYLIFRFARGRNKTR